MPGTFAIRHANRSDAEALSIFAAEQFRATYQDDTPASDLKSHIQKTFSTECQQAEIDDPSAALFLATANDQIIGYAHVLVGMVDAHSAFLNRIYVHADWKGCGVAKNLLEKVVRESRQRGAQRLELTVFERNARAIAFYMKSGFAAVGSTTFPVGEDLQTDNVMEIAPAETIEEDGTR